MSDMVQHEYTEEQIQVLEGLDPVRKRPGMYIGSTDSRGLHHLITEIVDNSIDEALAGYCTEIKVTLNKDGSVTVCDNGRGIPTGIHKQEGISAVELVLTKLHAGGKFGSGGYKISGGLHGVGLSVVNALSTKLVIDVHQNGNIHHQEYSKGVPDDRLTISGTTDRTGTIVTFFPDDEIFDTVEFSYDVLKTRFQEIAYLNKGLLISVTDARGEQEKTKTFCYEDGIVHFVMDLNKNKETLFESPITIYKAYNDSIVEIAMQYNNSYEEIVHSYANNINTEEGGAHLEGFKNALTKVVNDAARKLGMIKGEEKLQGNDVREGLTAVLSVKLTEPQFEGQTKTKLGNSEMRVLVTRAMTEGFGDFLEEHPAEARNFISKCQTAQKAREAARLARESTRRKGLLESTTLPGKLSDCTDKNPKLCEIYIVEGDSAGGTAKSGRDRRFQAILPLRGKILNVEKVRFERAMENAEIKAMITAFGCGYKENYNEDKLRYDRIICMTDADVDGSHIAILLLTFFYRFMRPLIENGHVYLALPPLFKVTKNKQDYYCFTEEEMNEKIEEVGRKGTTIQRYKGLGEMNAEQLWSTTMNPETRTLKQITMEDAETVDEIFTTLMGEEPELRRRFIEENATLVKELDI